MDETSGLADFLTGAGLADVGAAARTLTVTLTPTRFCGNPDASATSIHPLVFGPPRALWPRRPLIVVVDGTGCSPLSATAAGKLQTEALIQTAFNKWAAAIVSPAGPMFTFTFRPAGSDNDIGVTFSLNSSGALGSPGGVQGQTAGDGGHIWLDPAETWNNSLLSDIALHEIGHALGLDHSTSPGSVMYPFVPAGSVIDAESIEALLLAYAVEAQKHLPERATSGRPALAETRVLSFTGAATSTHMVWKGARNDQGIYHSTSDPTLALGWTPQERSPFGTTDSPALAEVGPPQETGLLMVWKGIQDDQTLYWSRSLRDGGWEPQRRLTDRGSNAGPAVAAVGNTAMMAWRGAGGDHGIYTSTWDGLETWTPQVGPLAGAGTSGTPALAVLNGRVYMFWKGVEPDHTVWWSVLDLVASPTAAIWSSQRQVTYDRITTQGAQALTIGTTVGPAAAFRRGRIVLTWKGAEGDDQIWLSLFDGTAFTGQFSLTDAGTAFGPGAVDDGAVTWLAWRGIEGDDSIWWKRV